MSELSLRSLQVRLDARGEILLGPLDLQLRAGECLGLVGESGSGKSLTALSLLGLLPAGLAAEGRVELDGAETVLASSEHIRLRGTTLAWMPQDPLASLHPLRRVGAQLAESLRVLRGLDHGAAEAEVLRLFAALELPDPAGLRQRYPHQLSGGQRQRVLLALALAGEPRYLIADEPTSALDPRLARELLLLLDRLRRERGLGLLLISHDLPLVAEYAQRVAILQRGRCVEQGASADVFVNPQQAYTRELLKATQLPTPAPMPPGPRLLQVKSLSIRYPRSRTLAVDAVDLELHRGQCLALVGESGSGKSSLGRALLRLLRQGVSGEVRLDGENLYGAGRAALRKMRRRFGVVFQDPYASLDPRQRIGEIVTEPLRIQGLAGPEQRRKLAGELLAQVGLAPELRDRYPHQFSGGQRQRIAIARALSAEPQLLICDEAVSALDAQHRAEILALLDRLKRERGLALLFITHDLAAARALADRLAVMQLGRIVEQGASAAMLAAPGHPYSRSLFAAFPSGGGETA